MDLVFDPNIYDPQFVSSSVTSLEEIVGGVRLRYWRKDYETTREWLYHPHYYRYSASSYMARCGRDYKDSNYYQNELRAYLDRFFYCTTSITHIEGVPYSPTPCGKVFFPVTMPIRVWWEGERMYPMYQHVCGGVRYLVWVDMGFSFYSSRALLEEVARTLALPLWDVSMVPSAEFVLYPLTSTPTVVAAQTPTPYKIAEGDQVVYFSALCDDAVGYECDRCGVWQIGAMLSGSFHCYQCQFIGRDLMIGLGPGVSSSYIALANRSPGTVVRIDIPGVQVVVLGGSRMSRLTPLRKDESADLIVDDIPWKFVGDGSVAELVHGFESHDVPYIFWGKVSDYPGRVWTLRYGEWARYTAYVMTGQAFWECVRGSTKVRKKIMWRSRIDPAPRLLTRQMMADWHDTTMQLTLAAVPLVEWISAIMPRAISSAKGVDDDRGETVLEDCEWL